MRLRRIILATCLAILHAPFNWSTSISLEPAADTCLFELQPDFNFGAQQDLPSGTLGSLASTLRSRLLLRFDLAGALPPNAVIDLATLRLSVTRVPDGDPVNSTFALHRMLRPWSEGTKQGGPPGGAKATAGESTWNARLFPDEIWTQPGGEPEIDYQADSTSSERIQDLGEYVFEFGQAQLVDLEEWLRHPENNHGWILISQAETQAKSARRFAAREHVDPSKRPELFIEYSVPSIAAPRITDISYNQNVHIRFEAQANIRYRLESTLDLASWEAATEFSRANESGEMSLIDNSGVAKLRFYRVAAIE